MDAQDPRAHDAAVEAGRARFRRLPERIRFEDMIATKDVSAHGGPGCYDPERSWIYFSCLAVDLGL
ncbi:hypothetical protein [Streptacidiphilus melanogenes]|uniref:hypothetical protein n=1 Tax=Streptacidiphilus melanogenes TaxID=411235 RepID=UPI0005A999FC|nr:hypothetical protein [Streptacidiphilus melanogenes]